MTPEPVRIVFTWIVAVALYCVTIPLARRAIVYLHIHDPICGYNPLTVGWLARSWAMAAFWPLVAAFQAAVWAFLLIVGLALLPYLFLETAIKRVLAHASPRVRKSPRLRCLVDNTIVEDPYGYGVRFDSKCKGKVDQQDWLE